MTCVYQRVEQKLNVARIEENKRGGVQWVGFQTGLIEYCGIYGNGVEPGKKNPFKAPKAVSGAHGILVKNVNATTNGLSITGCEIQGNADVQIMLDVGANLKITQNDFKSDDITLNWCFPRIDIQVGDGNSGRDHLIILWMTDIEGVMVMWEDGEIRLLGILNPSSLPHTVVMVRKNAIGTVIGSMVDSVRRKRKLEACRF